MDPERTTDGTDGGRVKRRWFRPLIVTVATVGAALASTFAGSGLVETVIVSIIGAMLAVRIFQVIDALRRVPIVPSRPAH
jgi:hypothetical protein